MQDLLNVAGFASLLERRLTGFMMQCDWGRMLCTRTERGGSLMSKVPLLAQLDAKEAAEIMPLLQAHNFPPHVEVVKKGAPGDGLYFIASGKLEKHAAGERHVYSPGMFSASAQCSMSAFMTMPS